MLIRTPFSCGASCIFILETETCISSPTFKPMIVEGVNSPIEFSIKWKEKLAIYTSNIKTKWGRIQIIAFYNPSYLWDGLDVTERLKLDLFS